MIEYLSWDTDFFRLKIGKSYISTLKPEALDALYIKKELEHYDLIYFFCDQTSAECETIITNHGGLLTDQKVTYQKQVDQTICEIPKQIKVYNGVLTDELLALALASGHDSRFKKDVRLAPRYDALYTQWITKSLDGSMADAVLVYQLNEEIQGFVTVKNKNGEGQIGLIAVSEKFRGKGIGTLLLHGADAWYNQHNISFCSVVTQLTNKQACLLYEKNSYTKAKTEIIYHL